MSKKIGEKKKKKGCPISKKSKLSDPKSNRKIGLKP